MPDSCSNNEEKQVLWTEKEIQVTGAMPDQKCFDKILLHLMPAWCSGLSQNICVRAVPVLSTPPGLSLLSPPSLSYPHSQPAAVHMEMLPSSGHRGLTAAPAGLTQFWLTSPGKPRAWGPSAAQNQHPNLQVTFSTAFKAVIPQTQSQMPNAGAFRWEPPQPGSDGVRAPGEFGQHPQHRVGSLGSLALLFRARSWTQWPVGPFQLRGFHHSEVHFYWIILLKNSRKPPYFQLHMS